jgi:hypothetical protein
LLLAVLLSACSTGVVPIGRDTYMVADTGASSWASGAGLKAGLYQQAETFCRNREKESMPVGSQQNDANFSTFAHAELQFRCLASDDPELKRPNLQRSPDIVIQAR